MYKQKKNNIHVYFMVLDSHLQSKQQNLQQLAQLPSISEPVFLWGTSWSSFDTQSDS